MDRIYFKTIGKTPLQPTAFEARTLLPNTTESVTSQKYMRFFYIRQGVLQIRALREDGSVLREILAKPGEMVFIECYTAHEVAALDGEVDLYLLELTPAPKDLHDPFGVYSAMHLRYDVMTSVSNLKNLFNADRVCVLTDVSAIEPALKRLIAALNEPFTCAEDGFKAVCLLFLFLTEVSKSLESPAQGYINYVKRVYAYIQKHLHEKFSLDEIAAFVGLHKAYLATQFKKYTGKTIMEAAQEIRIAKSTQLLMESNLSIAKIAAAVGFSYTQFLYEFKKAKGCSPTAFRKEKQALER